MLNLRAADIGYTYLIDNKGKIHQGRAGGDGVCRLIPHARNAIGIL